MARPYPSRHKPESLTQLNVARPFAAPLAALISRLIQLHDGEARDATSCRYLPPYRVLTMLGSSGLVPCDCIISAVDTGSATVSSLCVYSDQPPFECSDVPPPAQVLNAFSRMGASVLTWIPPARSGHFSDQVSNAWLLVSVHNCMLSFWHAA